MVLPWHTVEKQIQKEIDWLRDSIETFSDEEKGAPAGICRECLMRKIAVLIIAGKIKASQINKLPSLNSFWINKSKNKKQFKISHGKEWHSTTMKTIGNHFIAQGFKVEIEPTLSWGRADLGVYKKRQKDLFIEVGTTSFFKLWINLNQMNNFIYLIVSNDDKIIEFRKDDKK
jgi:hypothetical protein